MVDASYDISDFPAHLVDDVGHSGRCRQPYRSDQRFLRQSQLLACTWARNNSADERAARIQSEIGSQPIARWFGDSSDIGGAVADYVGKVDSHDKLPVLVAYNLPGRDACGGHSGGGAGSVGAYREWIASFAAGIGERPAVVIIEPDALGDFSCMDDTAIQERLDMLRYATEKFAEKSRNTWVYLDGGNAGWVAPETMADRLDAAGVRDTRGFAVNVSNYYTTGSSVNYANSINTALGYSAQFVVDTSRNGNGSNGEWCNPAGRKLGVPPQVGEEAEMLLWIKTPRQLRRRVWHSAGHTRRAIQPGSRHPADRRHLIP